MLNKRSYFEDSDVQIYTIFEKRIILEPQLNPYIRENELLKMIYQKMSTINEMELITECNRAVKMYFWRTCKHFNLFISTNSN
jgi:hypothetical protein